MTSEENIPEGNTMIAPFIMAATDETPAVDFSHDKLSFSISGIARTHRSQDIFYNAGKWIEYYDKQLDLLQRANKVHVLNLVFEFNLQDADDVSMEALNGLFARLEITNSRDVHVQIKWHYNSGNERMKAFLQKYINVYRIFFETINENGVPSFFIHPTDISPKIFFDTPHGVFRISGSSRPEHPRAFYNQVEKWIIANGSAWMKGHPVDIKMRYFNTSSVKCIMGLLLLINKIYRSEKAGIINWHYDADDKEELETVKEEFEANLQNLRFNYIPRKGPERL